VLGEVIAEAAGRPFPDHVTDAILRPAGMAHTGFTPLPHATATPYVRVPRPFGPLLNVVFPRELVGRRGGAYVTLEPFSVEGASYGGLVGTVTDAGRFASLHLADGTIHGRRLLAPTTAREMRDIPARDDRGPRDFGQGWFRAADHRHRRPEYAEHLGAGGGFYNALRIYPERNLGIVTMANTTSAYPHDELFERLVELPWRSGVTRDRRL
jgi:CubicO group peptidase (beta-lactamase class C family)